MAIKVLNAYEVIEEKRIGDLNSQGYLLKHKKSGARVMLLSNDDENKVFYIGFRTPPKDDTGLPHILEHSVLCGSKKFPAKDPFIELAKGSLNTFLNAMTYPDKTIYPIASCNDKDFQNLMHVYMDAVFYPNIYEKEEIFRQEGWHYDLESEEAELKYNGVVYNEMKGAFSSPEGVLDRVILNSLHPDTSYAFESGGDPASIPELKYSDFLGFHSKYYHPSNSYIYLYGDMDMEEKLKFLDEEYLSKYDVMDIDSEIKLQKPFEKPIEVYKKYSITNEETEEDNTYLSYNYSIGTSLDQKLYLAFQILEYALIAAPGAPLKKALLDAKIGKDIMGSYDNGVYQPLFSIVA
ncbi:MAG: insulinase family protein, partial [Lachnospiraceae bacterium]|nr:insulinase family protein [Lachnospiraceae bacterium]